MAVPTSNIVMIMVERVNVGNSGMASVGKLEFVDIVA